MLAAAQASDTLTATWQLSCLPSIPQYWRATPTECRPCLGNPVSSMIHQPPSLKSISGTTHWHIPSSMRSSDQFASATK